MCIRDRGKNNPFAYAVNSTLTVPAEAREAYVNAERWGDPKNYKWCSLQLEKDMTATDTYYITYHWEDQDNLAGEMCIRDREKTGSFGKVHEKRSSG